MLISSDQARNLSMQNADLINEPDVRKMTIDVLAEFFQNEFRDDPAGVGDWLAQGGTSVDLFVDLVQALRDELLGDAGHQ
jgi:hypothetical protein